MSKIQLFSGKGQRKASLILTCLYCNQCKSVQRCMTRDSVHQKISNEGLLLFCRTNQVPARSLRRARLGGRNRAAAITQSRAGQTTDCECFYFCLFVCVHSAESQQCLHCLGIMNVLATTDVFLKVSGNLRMDSRSSSDLQFRSCPLRACTHANTSRPLHFWGHSQDVSCKKKKKKTANWRWRRAFSCLLQGGGCEHRRQDLKSVFHHSVTCQTPVAAAN